MTNAVSQWSNSVPVAGQQFGYLFDKIGSRVTAIVNGRTANYTANSLNQYTSRTVPGVLKSLGSSLD